MKNEKEEAVAEITIEERGYQFASRIYKISRVLRSRGCELAIRTQLLKSGTSVGANLAEANVAYSKPELASKLGIALKELKETQFWLRLLADHQQLSPEEYNSLNNQAKQLASILYVSIRKLQ